MSDLNFTERKNLEELFEMSGGHVLSFSIRELGEFVWNSVKIDISNNKYNYASGSKANRLRRLWEIESNSISGKLIKDLFDHYLNFESEEKIKRNNRLCESCKKIINRLTGVANSFNNAQDFSAEDEFMQKSFKDISLKCFNLDTAILVILEQRIEEIQRCLKAKSSLAVIFLCGSVLEGLLLGVASKNPKLFNQSASSPKDESGKVKQMPNWTLSNFIDVAHSLNLLGQDVKKFSHSLRDFRNYIHPYQQMSERFNPDHNTAEICWRVVQAAIFQISSGVKSL
jgi:hypothetical protein